MKSYNFNKENYEFNITFDENKAHEKWTEDEIINSMYYQQFTHIDEEYKFRRLTHFLLGAIFLTFAIILFSLLNQIYDVYHALVFILIVLTFIHSIIQFVLSFIKDSGLETIKEDIKQSYMDSIPGKKQIDKQIK